MSTFLISMLAIIGGLIFFFVVVKFILTVLLPKAPSEGEGYISAEENAYILSANQTGRWIGNYPVMAVQIAIFPQEGPMLLFNTKSTFSYAEIPYLRANEPVRMSYKFHAEMAQSKKDNAVIDIKILGPAQVQWEGDSRVKDAVNLLVSRIEGSKLIDTQGEILSIERTNAILGGNPVFRYEVRFRTTDGRWIEGETYQAARPWLERQRYNGSIENVQYSATNSSDFIFAKR